MKVHYINILLFALALNILVYTHNKPSITAHHTTKIPNTRLLCECELYAPVNYDNDPQMKRVMQQFEDRASERLRDYDERMKTTRQKCREQCDKESQKIILKDKLEKELMDKFATLDTDIQSDAIPTCVCEKSMADKVEKDCLRCGGVLGGTLPELGLMGGTALYTLNAWKPLAIKAAIAAAKKAGAAKGIAAGKARGMEIVMHYLETWGIKKHCPEIYKPMLNINRFKELKDFANLIIQKHEAICALEATDDTMCIDFGLRIGTRLPNNTRGPPPNWLVPKLLDGLSVDATQAADALAKETAKKVTADLTAQKTGEIAATYGAWKTTIIASVVAIVVIVLIMVIIYLILRHRRKKKMKKKLQYIKLLEE
nr:rifin PIR protein,putative [Plasmodium sp. DRC-Itaito]